MTNTLEEQIRKDINNLPKDTITNEYGYKVGEQLDIDNVVEYVARELSKKDEEWKKEIRQLAILFESEVIVDEDGNAWYEKFVEKMRQRFKALLYTEGKE